MGRPPTFCPECRAFRDDTLKFFWAKDNKVRLAENHQRRMKDPEHRKKHNSQYSGKEYYNKYYTDNKETIKKNRQRYLAKPEAKALRLTHTRNRQAKKLNATPKWANQGYIKLFYIGAKMEAERIGQPVHVDHIVPLQHDLVCGLHCEQNLQWLTEKDNLLKGNTFTN